MRNRQRGLAAGDVLVWGLALALANGCSRPGAGGDEAGDGTTEDTGTSADLDGGTTGDEPVEFPEVVGTWVESRHVAGAAYVPSPEDPPPPCFGDFCFETFYCGRVSSSDEVSVINLYSLDGSLQASWYSPGENPYLNLEMARVNPEGGTWSTLHETPGYDIFEWIISWSGEGPSFVVAEAAEGKSYPALSSAAVARSVGDVVETAYRFVDVLSFENNPEGAPARLWVGEQRVWYGGIGEGFFFVDLETGAPSAPNVHLMGFTHSGAPGQVPRVFRELLDGRLVLLRVDQTSTCGIDHTCETAWTLVVMDPGTGEFTELHEIESTSEPGERLVADVDGHVVMSGVAGETPDPIMGGMDYLYVVPIQGGALEKLPGGDSLSDVLIDEDREVMVYGAKDGRVYVYDVDTGGAQEWFDLSPGSDEGIGFGGWWWGRTPTLRPFRTVAVVGGRLFVTYPRTDPAPCIYVADLP